MVRAVTCSAGEEERVHSGGGSGGVEGGLKQRVRSCECAEQVAGCQ